MLWARFAIVSALRSDISIDAGRPCTAAETPLACDAQMGSDNRSAQGAGRAKPTSDDEKQSLLQLCFFSKCWVAAESKERVHGQAAHNYGSKCNVRSST